MNIKESKDTLIAFGVQTGTFFNTFSKALKIYKHNYKKYERKSTLESISNRNKSNNSTKKYHLKNRYLPIP